MTKKNFLKIILIFIRSSLNSKSKSSKEDLNLLFNKQYMQSVEKLPSAASSQITVSNTAQTLEQFIEDAYGAKFTFKPNINACDLQVEAESIRYMIDGNTPTASLGILLSASGVSVKQFRGEELKKLKLIRATGSDATCNVQIGVVNPL